MLASSFLLFFFFLFYTCVSTFLCLYYLTKYFLFNSFFIFYITDCALQYNGFIPQTWISFWLFFPPGACCLQVFLHHWNQIIDNFLYNRLRMLTTLAQFANLDWFSFEYCVEVQSIHSVECLIALLVSLHSVSPFQGYTPADCYELTCWVC